MDYLHESERFRLPRAAEPTITSHTFITVPFPLLSGLTPAQLALYQLAFEQARQAARPSLPERDLAAVWN